MDDQETPSLRELLKGAAHGYDFIGRYVRGRDPQTRQMLDHMDKVSVEDALGQVDRAVQGAWDGGQPPTPHVDTRDVEDGVEVVVDTTGTPVSPDGIEAGVREGMVVLADPNTGWNAVARGAEPIVDVEVDRTDGVVTVRGEVAVVGQPVEDEEDEADGEEGQADPEPTEDDDADSDDSEPDTDDADDYVSLEDIYDVDEEE